MHVYVRLNGDDNACVCHTTSLTHDHHGLKYMKVFAHYDGFIWTSQW
jgi:hypothetical protein